MLVAILICVTASRLSPGRCPGVFSDAARAASDYVNAVADLVRPWVRDPFVALGEARRGEAMKRYGIEAGTEAPWQR